MKKEKTSKKNQDEKNPGPAEREKLFPGETELGLPDVKDIPGQEHIQVPPLVELADTTASSADEEGEGIFEDAKDSGEDPFLSNVSPEEREALADAAEKLPTRDQDNLDRAKLQQRDEDGEPLNEASNLSGSDLDVPGSEADDLNEEIGEEDEENNNYSLDSEDEDDSVSKGE